MAIFSFNNTSIHWQESGDATGQPIVFAHPLGCNLHVWDALFDACPALNGFRLIRFDIRGHGQSDAPPAPYTMGNLIRETEALLDHLGVREAVFVGAHIGGQIAQGLAVKRLDQIRALVLVSTAAKIGIKPHWDKQIDEISARGISAVADQCFQSWFSRSFQKTEAAQAWGEVLRTTSQEGYLGCCHAISGTDFFTPVSSLRLSTLGLSAYNDTLIPPDLMRDTVELIHGADFQIMPKAAHLSMIEQPVDFGKRLLDFLSKIGHGTQNCGHDCSDH